MRTTVLLRIVLCCAAAIQLTGCAAITHRETIPKVSLAPNSSGITFGKREIHGPKCLMKSVGSTPDVPSGVVAWIERDHGKETGPNAVGMIEVVSIEHPDTYKLSKTVNRWKQLIEGLPQAEMEKLLYNAQLQEIPWNNAGRCFPAKFRRREYPWGKAAIFLTPGYAQGKTGEMVNNRRLKFVVQGITHDGRYMVKGHFSIRHPALPDISEDTKGKLLFDFDTEDRKAAQWLNTQPDHVFEPAFSEYEAFLQALRIECH